MFVIPLNSLWTYDARLPPCFLNTASLRELCCAHPKKLRWANYRALTVDNFMTASARALAFGPCRLQTGQPCGHAFVDFSIGGFEYVVA